MKWPLFWKLCQYLLPSNMLQHVHNNFHIHSALLRYIIYSDIYFREKILSVCGYNMLLWYLLCEKNTVGIRRNDLLRHLLREKSTVGIRRNDFATACGQISSVFWSLRQCFGVTDKVFNTQYGRSELIQFLRTRCPVGLRPQECGRSLRSRGAHYCVLLELWWVSHASQRGRTQVCPLFVCNNILCARWL